MQELTLIIGIINIAINLYNLSLLKKIYRNTRYNHYRKLGYKDFAHPRKAYNHIPRVD